MPEVGSPIAFPRNLDGAILRNRKDTDPLLLAVVCLHRDVSFLYDFDIKFRVVVKREEAPRRHLKLMRIWSGLTNADASENHAKLRAKEKKIYIYWKVFSLNDGSKIHFFSLDAKYTSKATRGELQIIKLHC